MNRITDRDRKVAHARHDLVTPVEGGMVFTVFMPEHQCLQLEAYKDAQKQMLSSGEAIDLAVGMRLIGLGF